MSLLNIQDPPGKTPFSIFVLAFRPFFLGAGIFSVVSILSWMLIYVFGMLPTFEGLSSFYWHAHEMIYGYTIAVVAGFLLTAIKNWTGLQTLQNKGLVVLFLLWVSARISMLFGSEYIAWAAVFDLLFNFYLFTAALQPVLRVKQWTQVGIISKILLLAIFNGLFYLGALNIVDNGISWGIYGGLYLLLALVLTMGRRVIPFFIERGVAYSVQLKNSKILDIGSLVLFLLFFISDVFLLDIEMTSYFATGMFILSVIRLYFWHTPGIWKSSLLWGLYVALIFISIGFLFFALIPYTSILSRSLALHAFTVGGFSILTVSMMSRVILGHTGRDIHQPSRWVGIAQGLLLCGAVVRIFMPIFLPQFYTSIILSSQLLWIAAFSIFTIINYPILTKPRVDGASG